MRSEIFDDIAIESLARDQFGTSIDIAKVIVRDIAVGRNATATVFLTKQKRLYALIRAQAPLNLGDVQKIIRRMGLTAETYVPPSGDKQYFDRVANDRFRRVFPGRTPVNERDTAYYRNLAAYNPALVRIAEVRDGAIRRYDPDGASEWRVAAAFAYRRIETS